MRRLSTAARKLARAENDLSVQDWRRIEGLGQRAPQKLRRRHRHEHKADGQQDLVELVLAVKPAIEKALERHARDHRHDHAQRRRRRERHVHVDHGHGHDVAAERGEHAVREIDEAHEAHRHRQPDRHEVQHHREGAAVEQDADGGGERF